MRTGLAVDRTDPPFPDRTDPTVVWVSKQSWKTLLQHSRNVTRRTQARRSCGKMLEMLM